MDEIKQNSSKHTIIVRSIFLGLFVFVLILLSIIIIPYFNELKDPLKQTEFKSWITDLGFLGALVILGFEVLEIIVLVIPGQLVVGLAGVMFGPFLGSLITLIGATLASMLIYFLVKWLGKPFVDAIISKKAKEKWQFLNSSVRVEAILILLFFLPAIPNDILVYFAALFILKFPKFLLITTIPRIPSYLMYAFSGDALIEGDYEITIILISITIVITIICLLFQKKIIHFLEERFKK